MCVLTFFQRCLYVNRQRREQSEGWMSMLHSSWRGDSGFDGAVGDVFTVACLRETHARGRDLILPPGSFALNGYVRPLLDDEEHVLLVIRSVRQSVSRTP